MLFQYMELELDSQLGQQLAPIARRGCQYDAAAGVSLGHEVVFSLDRLTLWLRSTGMRGAGRRFF